MTNQNQPRAQKQKDEIELRPDGWERFEKAVDAAVKGGPKHRAAKKAVRKRKNVVT
jgi:hypothetical protein